VDPHAETPVHEPQVNATLVDERRSTVAKEQRHDTQAAHSNSPSPRVQSDAQDPASSAIDRGAPQDEKTESTFEELIRTRIHVEEPAIEPQSPVDGGESQRPIVRIKIGRVDVKAVAPSKRESTPPPKRTQPSLSLSDYLESRRRGER
jgi:hypothetical protein